MSDSWIVGKKKHDKASFRQERAVLVGVVKRFQTVEEVKDYLDELEFLANTAGAICVKRFVQQMDHTDSRTFIGSGKAEEIGEYLEKYDVDLVIFDEDLTAKQTSNLEKIFERKIVDRSSLILDIFARRARTAQARTQVELAQLQYLLPRLRGLWTHLERQRGGIGMRGPGEQEIETDRRIVRDKISLLKKKLGKIDQQNQTQRRNRKNLIRASLVGYTNVGKSTLMNLISKSDVFAENKLFATLDTTVRKVVFGRMPFLMSDTVGFIRKLPHHLIESFKSTLDEVRESDVLIHVVDLSHSNYEDHISTVNETLHALGAADKTQILVFNKIDLYRKKYFDHLLEEDIKKQILAELFEKLKNQYSLPCILMSAFSKENLSLFRDLLTVTIEKEYEIRYPHQIRQF